MSTIPTNGSLTEEQAALIVIGMHRSGTSATTGALQRIGVELGRKLYSGHRGINEKGYFEHSDIADTNDEVLLSLGSAWDDILLKDNDWWACEQLKRFEKRVRYYIRRDFSNSRLWALKDPRICRLLPWWLPILRAEGVSPRFLFVIRSPDEVYRSLARRDGFSREKAFLLWVLHYLEAERESRRHRRAFMTFDNFLEDPAGEFTRIEKSLDLTFPTSPYTAKTSLREFLSADLRHHVAAHGRRDHSPIATLAYELESRLSIASSTKTTDGICIDTEDLWEQLSNILSQFHPILVEQLRSVARRRGQVELTIHRVMRSYSWHMGKPVRVLERLLGRDV